MKIGSPFLIWFQVENSNKVLNVIREVIDCKPVKQPHCRVPPYQREVIHQQLEEFLATDRIEQP